MTITTTATMTNSQQKKHSKSPIRNKMLLLIESKEDDSAEIGSSHKISFFGGPQSQGNLTNHVFGTNSI